MNDPVRTLTQQGIDRFVGYLSGLRNDPTLVLPFTLTDSEHCSPIGGSVTVSPRTFRDKLELGEYLSTQLASVDARQLRSDRGLWAWLVMYYLDQVIPQDARGWRKPLATEKYVFSVGDHRKGPDKQLLYFPFKMYRLHGPLSRVALIGPISGEGRATREWTSKRFNVCRAIVETADSLYFDPDRGVLHRGAVSTSRKGNLRRLLTNVLPQFELTYDVFGVNAGKLRALLPTNEFERWVSNQ